MKAGWWVLVSTVVLPALLGTEAEAGRTLREFSGDAMQRHDSRMMASPVMRYPGLFGISLWPYVAYPPAPSMTIVNVQIQLPELNQPPPPPPTSRARGVRRGARWFLGLKRSIERHRQPGDHSGATELGLLIPNCLNRGVRPTGL